MFYQSGEISPNLVTLQWLGQIFLLSFPGQEVDDAFAEFKIEDGMIDAVHLKSLMVAKKDGEES